MIEAYDFSNLKSNADLQNILSTKKFTCNVSIAGTNTGKSPSDQSIYTRVFVNDQAKCIEFKRTSSEPKDTSTGAFNGLKPRVELVRSNVLSKNVPYHIHYEFCPVRDNSQAQKFKAHVFQIFDHNDAGKGIPTLQYEIRDSTLYMQHKTIVNNEMGSAAITKIGDIHWGSNEWFSMDMYVVLSNDNSKGHVRVYKNGQFVFERKAANGGGVTGKANIQFGVYGEAGIELRTRVRELYWEKINSVPTGATINVPAVVVPPVVVVPIVPPPVVVVPIVPPPVVFEQVLQLNGTYKFTITKIN